MAERRRNLLSKIKTVVKVMTLVFGWTYKQSSWTNARVYSKETNKEPLLGIPWQLPNAVSNIRAKLKNLFLINFK